MYHCSMFKHLTKFTKSLQKLTCSLHGFLVSSLDDVVGESVEDCRRVGVQLLPDLIRDEHPIAVLDLVHDLLQLFDLAPSLLAILLRTQRESLLLLLSKSGLETRV